MAKTWPKIIGGFESAREQIFMGLFRKHIDDLDTASTGLVNAFVESTNAMNVAKEQINQHLTQGPRILQPAMIDIGSTDAADVLMNIGLWVLNEGLVFTVSAEEIDISALPGTVELVPENKKFRCLLTVSLTDGSLDVVQGEAVADDEDAATPEAPEGTLGFGYVEITTVGDTTFGATDLTSIATFHDLLTPVPFS